MCAICSILNDFPLLQFNL